MRVFNFIRKPISAVRKIFSTKEARRTATAPEKLKREPEFYTVGIKWFSRKPDPEIIDREIERIKREIRQREKFPSRKKRLRRQIK